MTECRATYLASQSEDEFLASVLAQARLYGWRVYHPRPARTSRGWRTPTQGDPGWPDLVLAHPERGEVLIVELKSERGRLEPDQRDWLAALGSCRRLRVGVWRPSHIDRITAILKGDAPCPTKSASIERPAPTDG